MDRVLEFHLSQLHLNNLYKEMLRAKRYEDLTNCIFYLIILLALSTTLLNLAGWRDVVTFCIGIAVAMLYTSTIGARAAETWLQTKKLYEKAKIKHEKDFPPDEDEQEG